MLAKVSKSTFKTKALELFRQIELSGESVIVTHRGQPTIEIRRYQAPLRDPLETLRGSVLYYDSPFEPVAEDEGEALR